MLIAYSILLILYVALVILYATTRKNPVSIPPWPLLYPDPPAFEKIDCQQTSDCPPRHICLHNQCIPKFLEDGTCQAPMGQWEIYDMKGRFFAVCQCTNEKLFTQPVFGADCTLSVACGVHGTYNMKTQSCDCDPGYIEKDLRCRKMSVREYQRTQPCASNESRASNFWPPHNYPFHADYITSLHPEDCVKAPCTFDALTGRPLKSGKAFLKNDWGCVCDPSYGLFGVQLMGSDKKYLIDEGFDACASILNEDPKEPIDVKLITYFYIRESDPLSIILYENIPEEKLHPLFRGRQGSFMLSHTHWRYDFAQHFFFSPPLQIRIRNEEEPKSYRSVNRYYFEFYGDFTPEDCKKHGSKTMDLKTAQFVLYRNPICLDTTGNLPYTGRFVVRPEHILFQQFLDDTPRYNAFVLEYEADTKRWSIDLDYPYKVDYYRSEAGSNRMPHVKWYS